MACEEEEDDSDSYIGFGSTSWIREDLGHSGRDDDDDNNGDLRSCTRTTAKTMRATAAGSVRRDAKDAVAHSAAAAESDKRLCTLTGSRSVVRARQEDGNVLRLAARIAQLPFRPQRLGGRDAAPFLYPAFLRAAPKNAAVVRRPPPKPVDCARTPVLVLRKTKRQWAELRVVPSLAASPCLVRALPSAVSRLAALSLINAPPVRQVARVLLAPADDNGRGGQLVRLQHTPGSLGLSEGVARLLPAPAAPSRARLMKSCWHTIHFSLALGKHVAVEYRIPSPKRYKLNRISAQRLTAQRVAARTLYREAPIHEVRSLRAYPAHPVRLTTVEDFGALRTVYVQRTDGLLRRSTMPELPLAPMPLPTKVVPVQPPPDKCMLKQAMPRVIREERQPVLNARAPEPQVLPQHKEPRPQPRRRSSPPPKVRHLKASPPKPSSYPAMMAAAQPQTAEPRHASSPHEPKKKTYTVDVEIDYDREITADDSEMQPSAKHARQTAPGALQKPHKSKSRHKKKHAAQPSKKHESETNVSMDERVVPQTHKPSSREIAKKPKSAMESANLEPEIPLEFVIQNPEHEVPPCLQQHAKPYIKKQPSPELLTARGLPDEAPRPAGQIGQHHRPSEKDCESSDAGRPDNVLGLSSPPMKRTDSGHRWLYNVVEGDAYKNPRSPIPGQQPSKKPPPAATLPQAFNEQPLNPGPAPLYMPGPPGPMAATPMPAEKRPLAAKGKFRHSGSFQHKPKLSADDVRPRKRHDDEAKRRSKKNAKKSGKHKNKPKKKKK